MVDTVKTPLLAVAAVAQSYYLDVGQDIINMLIGIATFIYLIYKIKSIKDGKKEKTKL